MWIGISLFAIGLILAGYALYQRGRATHDED